MQTINGRLEAGRTNPAPLIEYWLPSASSATGVGLVIFPGGGYNNLAEHEGRGYADYFTQHGIACFVVKYRLAKQGFRHPAMLEDALAAIATVRTGAADFGLCPDKIGVIGSSAGGHLAAMTLVAWNRYSSTVSLRPDFGILCYPVIMAHGSGQHQGSIRNLLGESHTPTALEEVACERHVVQNTPPCFIWHTADDPVVPAENSLAFAAALQRRSVSFDLHIYANGPHGMGLQAPFHWENECRRWLQAVTSNPE